MIPLHLLFCINRNFCWQLVQCLRSVVRFPCSEGYTVHVLHSDLTADDLQQIQQKVPEAEILGVSIDETFFQDFPETDRYPRQIYYRIFAAQFLPAELDRVLYLDTDTIAIQPLDDLYHKSFDGASYIACTHVRALFNKMNCLRLGIVEDVPYINTGVMVLNLKQLRQQQTTEDVLAFVSDKKNRLLLPDQDIITALYGKQIQLADSYRYNLSDRILAMYNARHPNEIRSIDWVRQNTSVIHYCGKNKPWKSGYVGKLGIFYQELLETENNNGGTRT